MRRLGAPWFATRFRLPFDAGAPFLGGCEPEVLRGAGAPEQRFPLSKLYLWGCMVVFVALRRWGEAGAYGSFGGVRWGFVPLIYSKGG